MRENVVFSASVCVGVYMFTWECVYTKRLQKSVKWKLMKCGEEMKDESTSWGAIVVVNLRSPPAVRQSRTGEREGEERERELRSEEGGGKNGR